MNKEQATTAMLQGAKLTHKFFAPGEWITMSDMFTIVFSTGARSDFGMFWHTRFFSEWKKDWQLFTDTNYKNEYCYRINKAANFYR